MWNVLWKVGLLFLTSRSQWKSQISVNGHTGDNRLNCSTFFNWTWYIILNWNVLQIIDVLSLRSRSLLGLDNYDCFYCFYCIYWTADPFATKLSLMSYIILSLSILLFSRWVTVKAPNFLKILTLFYFNFLSIFFFTSFLRPSSFITFYLSSTPDEDHGSKALVFLIVFLCVII